MNEADQINVSASILGPPANPSLQCPLKPRLLREIVSLITPSPLLRCSLTGPSPSTSRLPFTTTSPSHAHSRETEDCQSPHKDGGHHKDKELQGSPLSSVSLLPCPAPGLEVYTLRLVISIDSVALRPTAYDGAGLTACLTPKFRPPKSQ